VDVVVCNRSGSAQGRRGDDDDVDGEEEDDEDDEDPVDSADDPDDDTDDFLADVDDAEAHNVPSMTRESVFTIIAVGWSTVVNSRTYMLFQAIKSGHRVRGKERTLAA
jgi:hypothetical protein